MPSFTCLKIPTVTFDPNHFLFHWLTFHAFNTSSAQLSGTGTAHPFNEGGLVLYAQVPEHDISPFGTHGQGAGVSWVPGQRCGPPVKRGSLLEYPVRSQRVQKGLLETLR